MTELTVHLTDSLRENVEQIAKEEGCTVDQFLASAAAEKIAALRTLNYLRKEAELGTRESFLRLLAAVPSRAVPDTDRLD